MAKNKLKRVADGESPAVELSDAESLAARLPIAYPEDPRNANGRYRCQTYDHADEYRVARRSRHVFGRRLGHEKESPTRITAVRTDLQIWRSRHRVPGDELAIVFRDRTTVCRCLRAVQFPHR